MQGTEKQQPSGSAALGNGWWGIVGGLLGPWFAIAAIAQPTPTPPAPVLIAQVTPGILPPPPTVTFGEPPVFTPPPAAAALPQTAYLVYVNGNSPLMLDQVRAVEPMALQRDYNGRSVIQAGVFGQEQNAYQQVQRLEARGIGAMVEQIDTTTLASTAFVTPPPPSPSGLQEIEFGQTTNSSGPTSLAANPARYVVVVPGDREKLRLISQQIERLALNMPPGSIQYGDRPLGSHIQVGPFYSRGTAENWETYLRAFGMDARVHYR